MSLSEKYLAVTTARWDVDALREGRLVWQFWWEKCNIDLAAVTRLEWRVTPEGGSVHLQTPDGSRNLGLKQFRRRERLDLVRLLRRIIPEEAQKGWPVFCQRIAWPLLRSFDPPRIPQPGDVHQSRGRWDVIGGIGTVVTAGTAYFVWRVTGNAGAFGGIPLVVVLWLLMRSACPRDGYWVSSDNAPPGAKSLLITAHLGCVVGAALAGLSLRWLGPNVHPIVGLSLSLCASGVPMLPTFAVWRYYRPKQKAWRERKTAEALAEWQRRVSNEGPPG